MLGSRGQRFWVSSKSQLWNFWILKKPPWAEHSAQWGLFAARVGEQLCPAAPDDGLEWCWRCSSDAEDCSLCYPEHSSHCLFFLLKLVRKRCFEDWENLYLPAVCSQVCMVLELALVHPVAQEWTSGAWGCVMSCPCAHSLLRGFHSLHLSTKSSSFAGWISQAFWTQDNSL